MKGHVSIYQGSKLVHSGSNTIHPNLFTYLFDRLTTNIDRGLRNLFNDSAPQADHTGEDGIIYQELESGDWFTARTTFLTPPASNVVRFSGFFIPAEDISVTQLRLGWDLRPTITTPGGFNMFYATFVPSTPFIFQANIPVALVWEITIARGPDAAVYPFDETENNSFPYQLNFTLL